MTKVYSDHNFSLKYSFVRRAAIIISKYRLGLCYRMTGTDLTYFRRNFVTSGAFVKSNENRIILTPDFCNRRYYIGNHLSEHRCTMCNYRFDSHSNNLRIRCWHIERTYLYYLWVKPIINRLLFLLSCSHNDTVLYLLITIKLQFNWGL